MKRLLCWQGYVPATARNANSNTVQTLDETADQAAIIAKINELIAASRA